MRFSGLRVIKEALTGHRGWKPLWRNPEPQPEYDFIIVGGGGHGLATAYYLASTFGQARIAVLEKGWLGSGNIGRNTTIIRSNYLLPGNEPFYEFSMKLWEGLEQEFNFNAMVSQRGILNLCHSDGQRDAFRRRGNAMLLAGADAELLDRDGVRAMYPFLNFDNARFPIRGGLLQRRAGTARHDGVAWGYARGADRRGVEIHQKTAVTDIEVRDGAVVGVHTDKGFVTARRVLSAVAGWTTGITKMVGLRTPLVIHPLQAMVTEPLKPWLHNIVVSASMHLYVSQSSRGELVMGASLDPYEVHSTRSTLDFAEGLASHLLELFPFLGDVKILRQWAGLSDMTPDFSPIMGRTPIEGFYIDSGWGTWGFKATPVSGKTMAYTMANDREHELIIPFRLSRFEEFELVGEKGAASVGH